MIISSKMWTLIFHSQVDAAYYDEDIEKADKLEARIKELKESPSSSASAGKQVYAMKEMQNISAFDLKMAHQEADMLRPLDHKNIMKLIKAFDYENGSFYHWNILLHKIIKRVQCKVFWILFGARGFHFDAKKMKK